MIQKRQRQPGRAGEGVAGNSNIRHRHDTGNLVEQVGVRLNQVVQYAAATKLAVKAESC